MKKVKLFYHRNLTGDLQEFEARITKHLSENGPASALSVSEGSGKNDMIVVIQHDQGSKASAAQVCQISAWLAVNELESAVDELSSTRTVAHLSVYSSSQSSRRNVVIALMERASGSTKARTKQDEDDDAGTEQPAEDRSLGADRVLDEGRAGADSPILSQEVRSDVRAKAGARKGRS